MIPCLHHRAPGEDPGRPLLIMLPGAGMAAAAFAEHGMVAAAQARTPPVDVIAAGPPIGLYLDGGIGPALHRDVVEPALARGHRRIWLLGISLGGMGALLYAGLHAGLVEGLVLLAPFLGTQGTVAEVAGAGGLMSWRAARSAATRPERDMLVWLQEVLPQRRPAPRLYLGYGRSDRFAPGHRLLAAQLPAGQVFAAEGGHDWDTWATLWWNLLATSPFALGPAPDRRPELDDGGG